MKRALALLLMVFALVPGLLLAWPLIAQDQVSNEEQKDWLVQFVEGQLSTPDRQIRISNIDGILSQDASIREITISDAEGVWLRVVNAAINWDQGALFTGRLFIRTLKAERIEYIRNAIPAPAPVDLPPPETGSFAVPEFPIAIIIEQLSVPSVTFGENVFGLGSEISVAGGFKLEGGSLDANLDIARLDGPGGTLGVKVVYTRPDNAIDVAVKLIEPPDGIMANLLNIDGRPAMAVSVTGAGPVADLRTEMTLDAGDIRALSGGATITQQPEGFAVAADLRGPISELMDEPYREFFGAETTLAANALVRSGGGIDISALRLGGGQLSLEGMAQTTTDGFLRVLQLKALIADPIGDPVVLPIAGADTTIEAAQFTIDYGGAGGEDWTADLAVTGFGNAALSARTLTFSASGVAANLDNPATRRVTFNGDGALTGIGTMDADVQAALGDEIGFGAAGLWTAGEPLQLAELRLAGKAIEMVLAGQIAGATFDGGISINTSSIAPFSGVAGRDLNGTLTLAATGTISPLSGGFDLTLDGTADNLQVDEAMLDQLLAGTVQLSGRVARNENGLEAEGFRLTNQQVQVAADGTFATGKADFVFTADLADLALISDQASGPLSVVGTARGEGDIALSFSAKVPSGSLAQKALSDADVTFAGALAEDGTLAGSLTGAAFLDGFEIDLASGVIVTADEKRLSDLSFNAGPTRLSGNLAQDADGLLTGELVLASPNITTAAALLLTEASGAANASITLSAANGEQNANIAGSVSNLNVADISVGSADIRATIGDLFGVPAIDGTVVGKSIVAAGMTVTTLDARAAQTGDTTSFAADADLSTGTAISVGGSLSPLDDGYRLALDTASLMQGAISARLAQPAAFAIAGNSVSMDDVVIDIGGGGRVTATGTAGETLDVSLAISSLPLSIANAVAPGLALGGTINGTAKITGAATAPNATFQLAGTGITAQAISAFGITPLSFNASGSYGNDTVTLSSATASGAGGLQLAAKGTIPLNGRGLALDITGSAPLALGNQFVADRGGQLSGTVNLSAKVTGSLASPQFAGSVSTGDGGYVDPELNLRLTGIALSAALSGDRVTINSLSASLSTGGSVAVSGSVGLTRGNQADLAIRLNSARYADGSLFVATVSGDLRLSGPLMASPLLSGDVLVEKAEITVPDNFGGGATLIDVRHIDPPGPVVATLERATIDAGGAPIPAQRRSAVQLDVNVRAPNQIFIRGRGLDVEAGGSVRLTGPIDNIQPVGGFSLNRGRLSILGQRIVFDTGRVTLVGDLDPVLDFVARTEGDDITVIVTVSGRASEMKIDFTSTPALPQDEVLARLLFKRSMGELSPLQLAKLAGAAAELAGGGGSSLLDSLRASTGLDDLDVVTDAEGNLAVEAGRYIQDNIYLGVQAGADGQARVSVNLDITDDVKAKVSTGTNGNSSVGIFYESDY